MQYIHTYIHMRMQYKNASEASKYGDRDSLEDPTLPYSTTVLESFQFDHTVDGYKVICCVFMCVYV